ncbi:sensor histidine kinase, partial [Liquorilactobacillus vini]
MKQNSLFRLKNLLDQLPLIVAYLLLIGLGQALVWLKDDRNQLALDLLRFSWAPFLLWLFWRLWRKNSAQQQLLTANQQNQLPKRLPPGALSQVYYQVLAGNQELFETRLQQLQLSDQQRKTYFNLWSHEMKLPLTVLKLAAENDAEIASELVLTQTIQIENQLELLLNYERLADFHHDLQFSSFSLRSLIVEIIKNNSILFIQKQLQPEILLPVNQQLLTDRKWLAFCLQQIVFNSLKYATAKTKLTFKLVDGELLIQDRGIGISSDDLPRVFEAGFTGKNGRQQQAATGMGLYLVKQVCNQLEIDFRLNSVERQGTTVHFVFPKAALK